MNLNEKYYQIRIGDLNYGNHLGHDRLITLIHDARCSFFENHGIKELSIGQENIGLIVSEIYFNYKSQLFFLDNIKITSHFYEMNSCSVKMESVIDNMDKNEFSAVGYTKLVCFDFKLNKVIKFPGVFKELMMEYLKDDIPSKSKNEKS